MRKKNIRKLKETIIIIIIIIVSMCYHNMCYQHKNVWIANYWYIYVFLRRDSTSNTSHRNKREGGRDRRGELLIIRDEIWVIYTFIIYINR